MPLSHPVLRRICCAAAIGLLLAGCANSQKAPDAAPLNAQQIQSLLASPDRTAADRATDERRKPAQLLAFIGVKPGQTVLDLSAGGGYTTELLARAVGPTGRVVGQSRPPQPASAPAPGAAPVTPEGGASAAPAPRRIPSPVALAERARKPQSANITAVVRPLEDPAPPELAQGGFDLVTFVYNYHDTGHLGVDRARMNQAVFKALKPGGTYVIIDHAGRRGTGISESGTLHRVDPDFVIEEVEAAGFRLIDTADFLRNRRDPRDRNQPEPPMPKDGFVMKFIKPVG